MKTCLLIMLLPFLVSCGNQEKTTSLQVYSEGGKNAIQYVKEQIPEQCPNIDKVEIIHEDSLLSDRMPALNQVMLANAGLDYYKRTISREKYKKIIDDYLNSIKDIKDSWSRGVVNDSLKKLNKYNYNFRKVYTIKVTMKSNTEYEYRVLMDQDGITPRITEEHLEEALNEYMIFVNEAYNNLSY